MDEKQSAQMDEKQSVRNGKIVFWITFAFCAWIIWYVTVPNFPVYNAGKEGAPAEKAADTAK